ncbi:MAG: hypothetical protein HY011_04960 [Acidobacteria bacterium]|nr:hypothetical protein [Acidobacteriota bacterium]
MNDAEKDDLRHKGVGLGGKPVWRLSAHGYCQTQIDPPAQVQPIPTANAQQPTPNSQRPAANARQPTPGSQPEPLQQEASRHLNLTDFQNASSQG